MRVHHLEDTANNYSLLILRHICIKTTFCRCWALFSGERGVIDFTRLVAFTFSWPWFNSRTHWVKQTFQNKTILDFWIFQSVKNIDCSQGASLQGSHPIHTMNSKQYRRNINAWDEIGFFKIIGSFHCVVYQKHDNFIFIIVFTAFCEDFGMYR